MRTLGIVLILHVLSFDAVIAADPETVCGVARVNNQPLFVIVVTWKDAMPIVAACN